MNRAKPSTRELLIIEYRRQLYEGSYTEGNMLYVPVRNLINLYVRFKASWNVLPELENAMIWIAENCQKEGFGFINKFMPIEIKGELDLCHSPELSN